MRSNYLDGYEFLTIFENNDANFSGINDKNLSNHIFRSQNTLNPKSRAKEYQSIVREIGNYCVIRPLFTIGSKTICLGRIPLQTHTEEKGGCKEGVCSA